MAAKANQKPSERRRDKRFAVVGSFPAEILRKNGTRLGLLIQDLSKRGIGVVLDAPLKPQEKITLEWLDNAIEPIEMQVIWIKELTEEDGTLFHCGLQTRDLHVDLELIARSIDQLSLDELD